MWHSSSKLEQVKKDARQLADSVMSLAEEEFHTAGSSMQEFKGTAREKLGEAKQMARQRGGQANAWAHQHVWKTAAISAAVGVGLAMLFSGRRRR